MIKIIEYATKKIIAEVPASKFSEWCYKNGWLPHHKAGKNTWVVIK